MQEPNQLQLHPPKPDTSIQAQYDHHETQQLQMHPEHRTSTIVPLDHSYSQNGVKDVGNNTLIHSEAKSQSMLQNSRNLSISQRADSLSELRSTTRQVMPLNPQLHSTPQVPNRLNGVQPPVQSFNREPSEERISEARAMPLNQQPTRSSTPDSKVSASQCAPMLSPPNCQPSVASKQTSACQGESLKDSKIGNHSPSPKRSIGSAKIGYQLISPSREPARNVQSSRSLPVHRETPQAPGQSPLPDETLSAASEDHHTNSCASSEKKLHTGTERTVEKEDKITRLVAAIKASLELPGPHSLIRDNVSDTSPNTLRISHLPLGITYDKLYSLFEPFGHVEQFTWGSSDPYVGEVTFEKSSAAHEAKHFLGGALIGTNPESPLKVHLQSRDDSAELLVGDLAADVTEELLESTFSKLVGEPVLAVLKRNPEDSSSMGCGLLSFESESSASRALAAGHRVKVGKSFVRIGRSDGDAYLYISELSKCATMEELSGLFGTFGGLVEEDTVIARRSYSFVRYKNRSSAEKAKRTLDKTDLKGRISVRYAEAEPVKAIVAVQFHSTVPRPPASLEESLTEAFSKHGECSIELPRMSNGMWRKVAFVTFHGDPVVANAAAVEAMQAIRFIDSLPVCCQFARELIPRLPSKGLSVHRMGESSNTHYNHSVQRERHSVKASHSQPRRHFVRRPEHGSESSKGIMRRFRRDFQVQNDRHFHGENNRNSNIPNFLPVFIPISALQHPNASLQGAATGQVVQSNSSGFHWRGRLLVAGNNAGGNIAHHGATINAPYAPHAPIPHSAEHVMRWK